MFPQDSRGSCYYQLEQRPDDRSSGPGRATCLLSISSRPVKGSRSHLYIGYWGGGDSYREGVKLATAVRCRDQEKATRVSASTPPYFFMVWWSVIVLFAKYN
jgi:hypothetical protein